MLLILSAYLVSVVIGNPTTDLAAGGGGIPLVFGPGTFPLIGGATLGRTALHLRLSTFWLGMTFLLEFSYLDYRAYPILVQKAQLARYLALLIWQDFKSYPAAMHNSYPINSLPY